MALFISGLCGALFWTLALFFQDRVVGLTPFQMVFLGTAAEIAITLCEIPTGVVADSYSRKLSVIIGFALVGVGYGMQPLVPSFAGLLFGMVLWGIGETFLSGAFEAWVADELIAEGSPVTAAAMYVRGTQANQLGSFVGIWLSVWIGSWSLGWPLVASGVGYLLLGGLLFVIMPEKGFHRNADRETWARLWGTVTHGFRLARARPLLLDALLIVFLIGFGSEVFDRLWNKHLTVLGLPDLGSLSPIVWFAIIRSLALVLSFGMLAYLRRRKVEADGKLVVRAVMVLGVGLAILVAGFGLATTFWLAFPAYILASAARRCLDPLMSGWINDHAEPEVRATMLSLKGQTHGFGELFGGPVLGSVAQLTSIRFALLGSSFVNLLATMAAVRSSRRVGAQNGRIETESS
jgi:DHA3 family tetracycline resistance protein-like MFS transporter